MSNDPADNAAYSWAKKAFLTVVEWMPSAVDFELVFAPPCDARLVADYLLGMLRDEVTVSTCDGKVSVQWGPA